METLASVVVYTIIFLAAAVVLIAFVMATWEMIDDWRSERFLRRFEETKRQRAREYAEAERAEDLRLHGRILGASEHAAGRSRPTMTVEGPFTIGLGEGWDNAASEQAEQLPPTGVELMADRRVRLGKNG